ncbi:hypothetical protein B0H15DRAFT_824384 [Mycena belliarum]|uniref:NADH-ubiquinone oxidoreductase B15 subunit n=1 Tax=Mycena belliarum TaxID=1033014 RepID=A0AAD6XRM3_9AGAR|nr:hypothetical protein B0H15DRAFT_824384 [Mycena belliae]
MTGHAHVKVHDAAIERQSLMRENQYKHFRWTNTTVRTSFWGALVFPIGLFLVFHATQVRGPTPSAARPYSSQNKWEWAGKRRDQSLVASPKS